MTDKLTEIQSNIYKLIENNLLHEAKSLLENYRTICDDSSYYSLLSVISYLEGNNLEAQIIIREGLSRFPYDSDLYYNLSKIYEMNASFTWADFTMYFSIQFNNNDQNENNNSPNINSRLELLVFGNRETVLYLTDKFPLLANSYNLIEFDFGSDFLLEKVLSNIALDARNIIFFDDVYLKSELNEKLYTKVLENLSTHFSKLLILKSDLNLSLPVEGFKYKLRQALLRPSVTTLILGLSYAEVGLIDSKISNECINMALSSQDLFYDLKILKLFLENKDFNIKKVVINLAYYSFRYDLSKTFERDRIRRYVPLINDGHHYDKIQLLSLLSHIYKLDSEEQMYLNNHIYKTNQKISEEAVEKGKQYAKFHSKIGSNKIEEENIEVFKEFLKVFEDNSIEPYILICPVTKYYHEYFDVSLKDRFYKILNSDAIGFKGKIIDYFDSELFIETDFWDDSHLNDAGAHKLTNLVASILIQ